MPLGAGRPRAQRKHSPEAAEAVNEAMADEQREQILGLLRFLAWTVPLVMAALILTDVGLGLMWDDIAGKAQDRQREHAEQTALVHQWLDETDRTLLENRAMQCRSLIWNGSAPLDPDGPCFTPEVLRYYDPAAEIEAAEAAGAR